MKNKKREKVKAAREEAIRKKKEQVEEQAEAEQKKLDDTKEEKKEGLEEEIQEPEKEVEVIQEVVGEGEKHDCCTEDGVCHKEGEVKSAEETEVNEPEDKKSTEPEPEPEPEPEITGDKVDSDLKQSLEDVDPWMANKLKEKNA